MIEVGKTYGSTQGNGAWEVKVLDITEKSIIFVYTANGSDVVPLSGNRRVFGKKRFARMFKVD